MDLQKEIENNDELGKVFEDEYVKAIGEGSSDTLASAKAYLAVEKACKGKKKKKEKSGFMKWLTENTPVNEIKSITFNLSDEVEKKEEVKKEEEEIEFTIDATVIEKNEEKRLVYGWASVIEKDGKPVIDSQGDFIDIEELQKAAHDYMLESREAHEMHKGESKGHTVESMVFTKEVQKALGIDLQKVGWFIVQKIEDTSTWNKIKKGEIAAFSIGGSAIRETMNE